jgi:hypothetical protein
MPIVRVRSYPDRPAAWRASVFLIEEGVLAQPQEVRVGVMPGLDRDRTINEHWVIIPFKQDLGHARDLLDEFDAQPTPDEPEWADQTEPDLSRLPAGLTVPCAGCRHDLRPMLNTAKRPTEILCPLCHRANDPVQRVIARHGPEALMDCYPDDDTPEDPEWTQEAVIRRLHLPCPHCACPLHALPVEADCPACARPFDKRAIVRHAFDAI